MKKLRVIAMLSPLLHQSNIIRIEPGTNLSIVCVEGFNAVFKVSQDIAKERCIPKALIASAPLYRNSKTALKIPKPNIKKIPHCSQHSGIRKTADIYAYRKAS